MFVHDLDFDTMEFFLTLKEALAFAASMDAIGTSVTVEIDHMEVAADTPLPL